MQWIGRAASLAFILGACQSPTVDFVPTAVPNPRTPLNDEFDRNLARWQASGITRYAFTYAPVCFCDTAMHLVVGDGDAVRIDGVGVGARPQDGTPAGVAGLFDLVRRAIAGDQATVTYDVVTGVPIALDSDPIANAIDDELAFTVTGWTLEPPDDRLLGRISTARQRWDRQQVRGYSMSIRITCDCVYQDRRFDLTVRDGDVAATSGGKRLDIGDLEGVPLTVEALFEFATTWATFDRSGAAFDRDLGYPTHIAVDPRPTIPGQAETIDVLVFSVP